MTAIVDPLTKKPLTLDDLVSKIYTISLLEQAETEKLLELRLQVTHVEERLRHYQTRRSQLEQEVKAIIPEEKS